jgi:hypothetical protein
MIRGLTGLVGFFDGLRLEKLLEMRLAVKYRLMALVIVDIELLAALYAPEAVLVPDQTLRLCLFHLEDDLAATAAIRVRVPILAHLSTYLFTAILLYNLEYAVPRSDSTHFRLLFNSILNFAAYIIYRAMCSLTF